MKNDKISKVLQIDRIENAARLVEAAREEFDRVTVINGKQFAQRIHAPVSGSMYKILIQQVADDGNKEFEVGVPMVSSPNELIKSLRGIIAKMKKEGIVGDSKEIDGGAASIHIVASHK